MTEFSERIKTLRKESGMRQIDLANAISCSKSTVSLWERGEVEPEYSMLCKLCQYFDTTINYLKGVDDLRYAPSAERKVREHQEDFAAQWQDAFEGVLRMSPKSRDIVKKVIIACMESDMKDEQFQQEKWCEVRIEQK